MDTDYRRLGGEIIRGIRGDRSQNQLNKRLGFSHNALTRWERGTRPLYWKAFVNLGRLCRKDISVVLSRMINFEGKASDSRSIVKHLLGDMKISEAARRIGVNRFLFSRWLSGKADPLLENILALLESNDNLFPFLDHLEVSELIPSLKDEYERYRMRRDAAFEHPAMIAVLCFITVDEYKSQKRHIPGFIADRIGIPHDEEARIIDILKTLDYIRWNGTRFEPGKPAGFIRTMSPGRNRLLYKYWAERATKELDDTRSAGPEDRFTYVIAAFDKKLYAQVIDSVKRCYEEIIDLIQKHDGHAETVKVLNIQLFDLGTREPGSK